MNDLWATFPATWRALLLPRRAFAIAVVAVPMIVAQTYFGGEWVEVALASLLVALFVLIAPASWRALFPATRIVPLPVVVRLVIFTLVGAACVYGVGSISAWALGIHHSFLTADWSLIICTAFFLVGGFGLGRDIEMDATLERERRRVALLEKDAEEARLLALRNHLDPHFIFNTLNAIAEWCRQDGAVAERAILQLSDILRAVLAGVLHPTWSLAKERALVDTVAALHLLRDAQLFTWVVDVEPGADDLAIPPLLLLPVVENAVKHGPAAGHRGRVTMSIAREGAGTRIVVENPGPHRGPRDGGEGVRMVQSRVALFTDGRGSFDLAQVTGDDGAPRTRATLRLPAVRA